MQQWIKREGGKPPLAPEDAKERPPQAGGALIKKPMVLIQRAANGLTGGVQAREGKANPGGGGKGRGKGRARDMGVLAWTGSESEDSDAADGEAEES